MEFRFDPDDSLKKIDHKIKLLQENEQRNQSRIERYMQLKARQFRLKLAVELFDSDWAEIIVVYHLRTHDLIGKDKKFESKAKSLMPGLLEALHKSESEYDQVQKVKRHYPFSTKDYE